MRRIFRLGPSSTLIRTPFAAGGVYVPTAPRGGSKCLVRRTGRAPGWPGLLCAAVAAEGLRRCGATAEPRSARWISLREPLLAEAAEAGYDYVCIDMQHGMSDYADAVAMLQAMARAPTMPIVRVPWNEPGIIGRVLDAGALGVIIPMVNSPEEASGPSTPAATRRRARAASGRSAPARATARLLRPRPTTWWPASR